MKPALLTIFFVTAFLFSRSQENGYMNAGYTGLVNKGDYSHGVFLGGGAYLSKLISAGAHIDFNYIDQRETRFAVAAADLRFNKGMFFLSLQPGWVLYDKTINTGKTTGNFSGASSLGVRWKHIVVMAGYQNTSFKSAGEISRTSNFKFNVGVELN